MANKLGNIFRKMSMASVMNDPYTGAVAQASGWESDPVKGIEQKDPQSKGAQQLAKSLTDISTMPLIDLGLGLVGQTIAGTQLYKGWQLARALNKGVKSAEIVDSPVTQNILAGKFGWAPKQSKVIWHNSETPISKLESTFPAWDIVKRDAPLGHVWGTGAETRQGFIGARPFHLRSTKPVEMNKPMVQLNESIGNGKNAVRNEILKFADQSGADAVNFSNIKDNTLSNQDVYAVFKDIKLSEPSKNSVGQRIDAVLDEKYKDLPLEKQNKAFFDDFLEGRKLATEFFNSDVKRLTDLENEQLAKSFGYKFLKNDTAVDKINKPSIKTKPGLWLQREGYGGFYLDRDLPLRESSLGQYNPSTDSITLSGLGDIQEVSMHEHLHRGRFGQAPRDFPMDESKFKAFRDTEKFYQKITDDIIDPTKPYNEYVEDPSEAATNLLEIGRRAGLKLGQEYPGDNEASKAFKEIIDNDKLKGWMLDKFKWKDEPKKIWKALTGRYYLLPIIGYAYGNRKE